MKELAGGLTGRRQKYSSSRSSSKEDILPVLPPTGDDVAEVGDRCFLTSPDGGEMDFAFLDPRRFFPPDCDACSQFHQFFKAAFVLIFILKMQSQSVNRTKLWKTLLYEKSAYKM